MEISRGWVLVIGILIITALAAASLVWLIQASVQRSISPVQELTGDLSTQVSSVLHPTPTILPSPLTIIHDIRSLARLETIQFSLEKVITAESDYGSLDFLFGDKLIFIVNGEVIAVVDLAKFGLEI